MTKSFSQGVSTGAGPSTRTSAGSFSKSISSGDGSAVQKSMKTFSSSIAFGEERREIEVVAGSKEWQKILKDVKRWKKEGGVLRVKIKGESKERSTIKILPKFTPAERARLQEVEGLAEAEIDKIEALRTHSPQPGFTRYIDPGKFPEGGDAWCAVAYLGFVDIDSDGFIHEDIPSY